MANWVVSKQGKQYLKQAALKMNLIGSESNLYLRECFEHFFHTFEYLPYSGVS